jgi:hypothetical protein
MQALCFNRVSSAGKRVSSEAKPLHCGVSATLEPTWSFARLSQRHFFHLRPSLHCGGRACVAPDKFTRQ